jgi:hypothetical protein
MEGRVGTEGREGREGSVVEEKYSGSLEPKTSLFQPFHAQRAPEFGLVPFLVSGSGCRAPAGRGALAGAAPTRCARAAGV